MGTDCYILTQSSSDHSSTSFASWLGCSTVGHWGPQVCKLILMLASCPQLTPTVTGTELTDLNWLKPSVAPVYIFVWHPPASSGRTHLHRIQPRPQIKVIFRYLWPDAPVLLFFLFTQVHLLIDGSVEGQHVTKDSYYFYTAGQVTTEVFLAEVRPTEYYSTNVHQLNCPMLSARYLYLHRGCPVV